MTLTFTDNNERIFYLSDSIFSILDRNNVFDEYQEDTNYHSDNIFKTGKENIESLHNDIIEHLNSVPEYLVSEFNQFCDFIKNSGGIVKTTV